MSHSRSSRRRPGAGNGSCGARRAIRAGFSALDSIPPRRPAVRRQSSDRDRRARAALSALLRGEILGRAAAELAAFRSKARRGDRREQAEIHVHRLERGRPGVDGLDMAAGDMGEQRAMRGGRRRRARRFAAPLGGGKARGEQADGGGFHIALAAGDLAGKAPARIGLEPQRVVEQLGRIEEGVAVQAAEPREFRVLQAGNGCGRCAPARRVSAWSGSRPC